MTDSSEPAATSLHPLAGALVGGALALALVGVREIRSLVEIGLLLSLMITGGAVVTRWIGLLRPWEARDFWPRFARLAVPSATVSSAIGAILATLWPEHWSPWATWPATAVVLASAEPLATLRDRARANTSRILQTRRGRRMFSVRLAVVVALALVALGLFAALAGASAPAS